MKDHTRTSIVASTVGATTVPAKQPRSFRTVAENFRLWRGDIIAGLATVLTVVSICLPSGVLIFSQLGADYVAHGAAATLYAIVFGAAVAALVGQSSFIVSSPRSQLALVQASLAAQLIGHEPFATNPDLAVGALAACVCVAGIFQSLLAVSGFARITKYAPHTVLTGFVNGAALAIILSQLKQYIDLNFGQPGMLPFVTNPAALAFILLLAASIAALGKLTKKISAPLAGIFVGISAFYGLEFLFPNADFGRTIGELPFALPPSFPVGELFRSMSGAQMASAIVNIVLASLAIAVLGTLESLIVFRHAQAISGIEPPPVRSVLAQGLGNVVSGAVGGMAISASPGQTTSAYRNGGRTRLAPLTISITVAMFVALAPNLFSMIPVVVMVALLVQTGYQNFDSWGLRLAERAIRATSPSERRRSRYDLAIIGIVMIVTLAVSAVAGIIAGTMLACVVFIMNMSRPTTRREYFGDKAFSKRFRCAADRSALQRTGRSRVYLELQGVLFFGNADSLNRKVSELFPTVTSLTLDFRSVSEIDVTGANVLKEIAEKTRKSGKLLLFCNVPEAQLHMFKPAIGALKEPCVFQDLDTAMEWVENIALDSERPPQGAIEDLPLDRHDLIQGLSRDECAWLERNLVARNFASGTTLSAEGASADRMWILTRGSVSIYLRVSQLDRRRRIAGLAAGTTVGEMALLQGGTRSADIVADDAVAAYELDITTFNRMLAEQPGIAARILWNLATELTSRLRVTSDNLRVEPS